MDISFFQAYPFDLPCSRAFNGDGENNVVEFSNKTMMVKVSDESKKKQRGSRVCSRGHWRVSEDSQLTELVSVHGPQNWNHIAEKMQGRTGKSCRLRWFNQLDPRINKRAFSVEEEERLLAAHGAFDDDEMNMEKNSWKMLKEGTTNMKAQYLQEEYRSPRMPMHGHYSTFSADSLALTLHVSIQEPSSSLSSLSLPSSSAEYTMVATKPPAFIDFLGVGHQSLNI
ncbi:hypothetical protein YC2023_105115 [Brassica napus]